MILIWLSLLCIASVPLRGGRLSALVEIELRAIWAILAAIGLQVVIITLAPGGSHALHSAGHVATYALAAWFVWANRRIPGILIVALGGALNLVAISANGGVMPAWAPALRISGIDQGAGYHNSAVVAHPHLQFLGDVIPIPGPWPIGNVLSVGDLILFAGVLVLLHRTCGRRAARVPDAACS